MLKVYTLRGIVERDLKRVPLGRDISGKSHECLDVKFRMAGIKVIDAFVEASIDYTDIPDDVTQGGTPGHFAIAPVDQAGKVDLDRLEAWAMSRGTGETHEFTQHLLNAVVSPNAKGISQ